MNDNLENDFRRREYNHYYNEEYSTEFADKYDTSLQGDATRTTIIVGIIGLVSAITSFFMHPLALGIIGIGTGIFSAYKGAKMLGAIVTSLGIISLLFYFLNFYILR